jgi:ribosomal protein S18 acetylase RimI-like enzyme
MGCAALLKMSPVRRAEVRTRLAAGLVEFSARSRPNLRYDRAMTQEPASPVSIRLAVARDAASLAGVELSAGALFRTLPDLAWVADEPLAPAGSFLPLIAAETVWVAQDTHGRIVGELRGEIVGDVLHILELAVAKGSQQRGIGRRLLDVAMEAARARGLEALTLTTFRQVAWNAPFYARHGFTELSEDGLDARLREILRAEDARGLPNRCAMRLSL